MHKPFYTKGISYNPYQKNPYLRRKVIGDWLYTTHEKNEKENELEKYL